MGRGKMAGRKAMAKRPCTQVQIGHDVVATPSARTMLCPQPQDRSRRIGLTLAMFAVCFSIVTLRVLGLAWTGGESRAVTADNTLTQTVMRPDIVDRHGTVLATDIVTASLFADAARVPHRGEAALRVSAVLPDMVPGTVQDRLESGRRFVWLKRDLTPKQQHAVHNLGVPGLGFRREHRRVYPNGHHASHLLGLVNIDNHGTAGMERYADEEGLTAQGAPVALSIDLRVQHAIRAELVSAMEEFSAKAAVGIVVDVRTGEVMGMSSLPDFDPNEPAAASRDTNARFNRATLGVYEMGSIFKALTVAAALDSGQVTLADRYDARKPLKVSRFTIDDYHAKRRWLSVPEVFMYSSNIGTAQMALDVGSEGYRGFLDRLGLLRRVSVELPEVGTPLVPAPWREISTMTISYGHGLSVTPLQMVSAAATLVNGGYAVKPTLLAQKIMPKRGERVMSAATSRSVRALMRLVVERGTGRKADVDGYPVIGKTGTAEKVQGGGYARRALLTSFLSAFPANDPEFAMLVMLDEPKGTKATHGYATAGWNAAPVTARIVRRIAPLLGVQPVGKWEIPVQEARLMAFE